MDKTVYAAEFFAAFPRVETRRLTELTLANLMTICRVYPNHTFHTCYNAWPGNDAVLYDVLGVSQSSLDPFQTIFTTHGNSGDAVTGVELQCIIKKHIAKSHPSKMPRTIRFYESSQVGAIFGGDIGLETTCFVIDKMKVIICFEV